jgi:hypothetical protein
VCGGGGEGLLFASKQGKKTENTLERE